MNMKFKNIIEKCVDKVYDKLESKKDKELRKWFENHLIELEREGKINA